MTSRTAAVSLLGVAVVAVAVLLATCSRDESVSPPDERGETASSVSPAPKPRSRERSRVEAPLDAATPAQPAEKSNLEFDTGFPSIDVEVVDAKGGPVPGANVYVLPAGSAGREDADSSPHTVTDARGVAHLAVPVAGTFDVGATKYRSCAMQTDVAVPASAPIRLTLPKQAEVVISATPGAARLLLGKARVTLALRDGHAVSPYPGRGDAFGWPSPVGIHEGTSETILVPDGLALAVTAGPGLSVSPESLIAPGIVRVDARPEFEVFLATTVTWPEGAAPKAGRLAVEIDPGPGGTPPREYSLWDMGDDLPGGSSFRRPARFYVGAPSGVVRWRGRGVVEGSAPFENFKWGVENRLDVTIRLDGTPLSDPVASGDRPETRVTFRITDPRGGTEPAFYFVGHEKTVGKGGELAPGSVATVSVLDPVWAAAWREAEVAGPVRVGPAGAENELTLVPGGSLRFALSIMPPADLGRITVERADGIPVLMKGLTARASLNAHYDVGPMPPGEYEFVVRAGEQEVRRIRATVVAGKTSLVVIPRLSAR